ncbi:MULTISPECIES: phosphoadenylyl-sulfate reductase [Pseudoalteromonas]|uniref:Phosphoadenosine 5'-phosphosulfate reductase n=1 Tax=Pseudoalteromonas amylolytica TaxID=1859457 RepID=A0A1S1MSL3_9GAMM|nr:MULTISPECIES: phosphoadenylyl-sulfate reductase [Pseudoalteromonas]OHU85956.1 phosphoadenosine phosphosulfate reductase [Pseudoalteromonas sp. JW3]OHU89433.1 phosphoadenosine phosphosulfate reductase [Pseudoalteromonas amylolytica]
MSDYKQLLQLSGKAQTALLAQANELLLPMSPQQRVAWALEHLPDTAFLSSSFGIQAAVMLHLVTSERSDIPVVLTDTGYLFPETYQFVDYLTERLNLNLKVYRAPISPAWQEAKYGRLWEQGQEGIKQYNALNKVEPMTRALKDLNAGTWFSGLRRDQASTRADKQILEISRGTVKVYPIIEWNNRDVYQYLTKHDLPYHPLWEQGYVSMGDVHTTRKLEPGMSEEETRFFGLNRECGLHIDGDGI